MEYTTVKDLLHGIEDLTMTCDDLRYEDSYTDEEAEIAIEEIENLEGWLSDIKAEIERRVKK